jgi:F-type H+-transporting ATPase subunit alpha
MSEQRLCAEAEEQLHAMRERVEQAEFLDKTAIVRRIRDEVFDRPSRARQTPDVSALLQFLRAKTGQIDRQVRFHEVGTVQHIGNGVATLSGLGRAHTDELVTFPTGMQGLVLSLDRNRVDVILLGPGEGIRGGDLVTATGERLRVPVGAQLLGRVVNPLGQPLDGRRSVEAVEYRYLERAAPSIIERGPVQQPLHTGLKMIDALVPIGRGQRELIIGDRQTGKTALAVDAILNQHDTDIQCIYVAIGQKKSSTLAVVETLRASGAMAYTTVVTSSPDDPPALRYLAPYAGCTMAEFLMDAGRDVLIVYDDLSKHADAYRELSLLLRRPPGREAYPGDIFYLHSRLLERACKLNEESGGNSMTALPIVEIQRGNLSAYIPTNLISITDGQIVLDADQFNRDIKPAVDAGRSVSRVGGAAQTPAMRKVAGQLRLELAQFEEVARFARFGTEVDEATQRQIDRGHRLQAVLKQPAHQPLALAAQIVILLAATQGLLNHVELDDIPAFEHELLASFEEQYPQLFHHLNRTGHLDDELIEAVRETVGSIDVIPGGEGSSE